MLPLDDFTRFSKLSKLLQRNKINHFFPKISNVGLCNVKITETWYCLFNFFIWLNNQICKRDFIFINIKFKTEILSFSRRNLLQLDFCTLRCVIFWMLITDASTLLQYFQGFLKSLIDSLRQLKKYVTNPWKTLTTNIEKMTRCRLQARNTILILMIKVWRNIWYNTI